MKKFLALMMALAMVFTMVACGASNDAPGSSEPTASEPTASEPAGDSTDAAPAYDEMTITFTVSNNKEDSAGIEVQHFTDYITEKSGGAIEFDIYWGGTLCSSAEVLDFVGGGSVNMCMTGTAQLAAQLPLTNFPSYVYGTQEDAVAYANYIAFENEETAGYIAEEMAGNGVVAIGLNAGGCNGYFFKEEYKTLADAAATGMMLGCGANLGCYEALGFNTTSTMPWDAYDQLSKGVIDCTTMAIAPGISMSWQEVAPYVLCNNQYSFGNWWLINQDVWNGMSADTQALFYEAAKATEAFSITQMEEEMQGAIATIEEAGGSFSFMNEEETAAEALIFFEQSYADCRAAAASAGVSEQMEAILAATNDYLGLDIQ